MNAYPEDYVVHNLPLILLSGLQEDQDDRIHGDKTRTFLSEGGFRIKADLPAVKGDTAKALLRTLLEHDSTNRPWHERGSQADHHGVFCIRNVGRTYSLPPRKAPPPAHSPRLRPAADSTSPPPQLVLHSTLSPCTPSSPLYPDGIMAPLWITKHQSRLPSIFMTFFALSADANTSTLSDNKLKSEIGNIRSTLAATNYKTKMVVVFVGDSEIAAAQVEERLNNIRRATNSDSKSLFFLPHNSSESEIQDFTDELLSGLYSPSLEYYRDLSKHARRKRSRNVVPQPTIPPTSGLSRTLPLSGWNLRYEFKLGIFAEFRQEIEAALRNYEAAYESLFSADVFEAIPSWSPRFNEARMLSDVIVIRIIRCVLWLGQTTNAVRWWTNHQFRIQPLLNKRNAGTDTYAWAAWQSTWTKVMADLIRKAEILLPADIETSASQPSPLFISTEKTLPTTQKYAPWESVHHDGYWLNLAQECTRIRRARALQIPDEDRETRVQPATSPNMSNTHVNERYMVSGPHEENPSDGTSGFDYSREITTTLQLAIQRFSEHGQVHMMDILSLKQATELIHARSYSDALKVLKSIWENQAWRGSGWWSLLAEIGQKLAICAEKEEDLDLVSRVRWELGHPVLSRSTQSELVEAGEVGLVGNEDKAHVALDTEHALSQVSLSFAFACSDGHVGEAMDAQLFVQYGAHAKSSIRLSQIKIVFEGSLKPVYLIGDNSQGSSETAGDAVIEEVKLDDVETGMPKSRRASFGAAAAVGAEIDLTLSPGQVRVFQMQVIPREAGEVAVASLTMITEDDKTDITITTSDIHGSDGQWWEMRGGKPVARSCGRQRDAASANIFPKPPKVEIDIAGMQPVYYTNEVLDFTVDFLNLEDETISTSLQIRLLSSGKNKASLKWQEFNDAIAETTSDGSTHIQKLPYKTLGEIAVGEHSKSLISILDTEDAVYHELEISIDYTLASNPETRLTKLRTFDVPIVRPFEANFNYQPRLHQDSWPNFFAMTPQSAEAQTPTGISHQYHVAASVCSFATGDLCIRSTRLLTGKLIGGAICTTGRGTVSLKGDVNAIQELPILVHPEETKKIGFDMTLQKMVLGDRQPVTADLSLEIEWSRAESGESNLSILHAPKFLILSSEPRVLLQVTKTLDVAGLYRLEYVIENPSLHFLTFNVSMESSDDFAFSGSKSRSLSLVPISRHNVIYRVLPNKSKAWIRVHLEVVDAYFGQTLKIQPASDGVQVDKQGNVLLWVE